MPIPPWEIEAAAIEHAHDLGDGPYLEKGLKQQLKSFLDLDIGIFHDNAGGITDQTYRQGERKLPALSLCEQPRCQPGTGWYGAPAPISSPSGPATIDHSDCLDRTRRPGRRSDSRAAHRYRAADTNPNSSARAVSRRSTRLTQSRSTSTRPTISLRAARAAPQMRR